MFRLSTLVSVGPQTCSLVWYASKRGVAHSPMLRSRHLNFVLVSLFLAEHTRQRAVVHCISQLLTVIMIQASVLPGLSHVIAVIGKGLNCWVEDRHKHERKIQRSHEINHCSRIWHLPLVLYCTNQSNERLYSFFTSLTDCIWYRWLQNTDKITISRNLNIDIRLKPKQRPHKVWRNTVACTVSSKVYSTGSPVTAETICKE